MAYYPFYSVAEHDQATSTGTGDVKTISAPAGAKGCYVTVSTTSCWMTFDGTTPSSSAGLNFVFGGLPIYFPVGTAIKFAAQSAANSVVNVMWVK